MLPENIIYLTFLSSALGYFYYFREIFKGNTKPDLVSWFLWMLPPFLGTFFTLKAGAGLSALPVFIAGFGPLLVVVISLFKRSSIWKITKLDIVCGTLSILSLVLYAITHSLALSIIFAILSDALATIPTLVKSWEFPETENPAPYLSGVFNNTLGLLIIKNWIFAIYFFGIYLIFINLALVFSIYRKKIFKA